MLQRLGALSCITAGVIVFSLVPEFSASAACTAADTSNVESPCYGQYVTPAGLEGIGSNGTEQSLPTQSSLPSPENPDCQALISNPLFKATGANFSVLDQQQCSAFRDLLTNFDGITHPGYQQKGITLLNATFAEKLDAMLKDLSKQPGSQSVKVFSGWRDFVPSGGAQNSNHKSGCAADLTISAGTCDASCKWIKTNGAKYGIALPADAACHFGAAFPRECNHVQPTNVTGCKQSTSGPLIAGATVPSSGTYTDSDTTSTSGGTGTSPTTCVIKMANGTTVQQSGTGLDCNAVARSYGVSASISNGCTTTFGVTTCGSSNTFGGGGGLFGNQNSMMEMMMGMQLGSSLGSMLGNAFTNLNSPSPYAQTLPPPAPLPPLPPPQTPSTPSGPTTPGAPVGTSTLDALIAALNNPMPDATTTIAPPIDTGSSTGTLEDTSGNGSSTISTSSAEAGDGSMQGIGSVGMSSSSSATVNDSLTGALQSIVNGLHATVVYLQQLLAHTFGIASSTP